ncbi:MAG: hypothetical protein LRZ85_01220 [Alphaproteobacteria bacterium]|nr:hypothetical protein [Alphaproteobacteria bacterium]MCD8570819.1 hypothetical protein [Alphaproteobacteria bacterium]
MSYKKIFAPELVPLRIGAGLLAVWVLAAAAGGLSDEGFDSEAAQLLKSKGFTPVEVGGYGWSDCGYGYNGLYATHFTAKDLVGETVTGAVCKGLIFGGSSLTIDLE